MKRVCIVTVCRNALPDLKLTAASVKNQCYPNIHYIVVDGASSDGTKAFLESSRDVIDDWMSEPDQGIYDAMNKAIDRCPSDSWVLFLNAGDCFFSDNVLQNLSYCFNDSTDFVFGDVAVRHAGGTRVYRARPSASVEMPGCHQSTLVRASLLQQHHFDTSYIVGADFEFYLRTTNVTRRVSIYDGIIAVIAPEGFTAKNEAVLRRDYVKSLIKYRSKFSAIRWLVRRTLSRIFRNTIAMLKA